MRVGGKHSGCVRCAALEARAHPYTRHVAHHSCAGGKCCQHTGQVGRLFLQHVVTGQIRSSDSTLGDHKFDGRETCRHFRAGFVVLPAMGDHQGYTGLRQLGQCRHHQLFLGLDAVDEGCLGAQLGASAFQATPAAFHEALVIHAAREQCAY